MLNNKMGKLIIIIITIILYTGSSYVIFMKNTDIKDKLDEITVVNEQLNAELKEVQKTVNTNLFRINELKQENLNLKNELKYYK